MKQKFTFLTTVLLLVFMLSAQSLMAGYKVYFLIGKLDCAGDLAVVAHLESAGHIVTSVTPDIATVDDAAGYDIMLISASIGSGDAAPYAELGIPILTWESFALNVGKLNMTDANADGIINYQNYPFATDGAGAFVNSYEYLNVSTDPNVIAQGLTAGKPVEIKALSNQIENTTQHCGTIGNPNNNAYRILFYEADDIKALAANNSTWATDIGTYVDSILCAAFVFPEGVEMATDFISPAGRGFIFLHEDTPTVLTSDAWAIFDAMVKWLIEGPITIGVNDASNEFKVYPSRVKDYFKINLNADQGNSNTHVSVYNVAGSLIKVKEFSGKNNISVNLSDINQGIYIVKIQSQNVISSYRIVKE